MAGRARIEVEELRRATHDPLQPLRRRAAAPVSYHEFIGPEIDLAMVLCGVRCVGEIDRHALAHQPRVDAIWTCLL